MTIVMMPVTDVRKSLNGLLERLARPVFVTAHGRVKAVLLDIDEYNGLLDRLDDALDAADPETRQDAFDAVTAHESGDAVPFSVVMAENGLHS
jgi:PHD/YefM family antitoxin component YafN of YafNO toxin-antitoxin module